MSHDTNAFSNVILKTLQVKILNITITTPNTTLGLPNILFKFKEIGLFWPDVNNNYNTDNIVILGKEIIIRDIYLFVDRIR